MAQPAPIVIGVAGEKPARFSETWQVSPPHCPRVVLDIGPAVHQNAGLARYAERLAGLLH